MLDSGRVWSQKTLMHRYEHADKRGVVIKEGQLGSKGKVRTN